MMSQIPLLVVIDQGIFLSCFAGSEISQDFGHKDFSGDALEAAMQMYCALVSTTDMDASNQLTFKAIPPNFDPQCLLKSVDLMIAGVDTASFVCRYITIMSPTPPLRELAWTLGLPCFLLSQLIWTLTSVMNFVATAIPGSSMLQIHLMTQLWYGHPWAYSVSTPQKAEKTMQLSTSAVWVGSKVLAAKVKWSYATTESLGLLWRIRTTVS